MKKTINRPGKPRLQRLFDRVANHLLTQNKPSKKRLYASGTACAYRGKDGLKCAVGCLITDKHYNAKLETCAVWHYNVIEALEKSLRFRLSNDEMGMLKDAQVIHDEAAPKFWRDRLVWLAQQWGLSFSGVTA